MRPFALVILLAATNFASVQAEEVTISHALAAGSLHEGPLDMVAYWLDGPDGALERECLIFCVWGLGSMLPERSKDDDDFQRAAGRVAEGLRAA